MLSDNQVVMGMDEEFSSPPPATSLTVKLLFISILAVNFLGILTIGKAIFNISPHSETAHSPERRCLHRCGCHS